MYKKILNFNEKPIFMLIPQNTIVFYLLNLDNKIEFNWFFNNYNCIYSPNNISEGEAAYLDFSNYYDSACKNTELFLNPILKTYITNRKTILKSYTKYSDFIIDEINNGRYIYLTLSIESLECYSIDVKYHNAFIYGYCLKENVFFVFDYFDDKFESKKISIETINSVAFLSLKEEYDFLNIHGFWSISKKLFSINDKDIPEINLERVIYELKTYFTSYSDLKILTGKRAVDNLSLYIYKMKNTYINSKGIQFLEMFCNILNYKVSYLNHYYDVSFEDNYLKSAKNKFKIAKLNLLYTNEKIISGNYNIECQREAFFNTYNEAIYYMEKGIFSLIEQLEQLKVEGGNKI